MNPWYLLSPGFSALALIVTVSSLIYRRRAAKPQPTVLWSLWVTTVILGTLAVGCALANLWWHLLTQNATLPPHA